MKRNVHRIRGSVICRRFVFCTILMLLSSSGGGGGFAWFLHGPQQQQQHPHMISNIAIAQKRIVSPKRILATQSNGDITDWVIENLESNDSTITSASTSMAGENDTLPFDGLCIGSVRILPSNTEYFDNNRQMNETTTNDYYIPIKLLVGRNGWGTGVHPTTRLCVEWLCDTIRGGETMMDYGCGSGILSITALHMGARTSYGVDIEAEALVTAVRNVQNNGYDHHHFVPLHTREVLPYGIHPPTGVDVCVANILIGQLIRPSMIAALISNIVPGGVLCLSGIRPGDQVETLKEAYSEHIEWMMDEYMELSASETPSSIDSYGFDCGTWCRLVGRKVSTRSRSEDIASMSDLAVS